MRRVKGLTQADLAELAGTSQQAIQQAECGKARNPRYLTKLAKSLDIPPEWLSLNEMPDGKAPKASPRGMAERDREVLQRFNALPRSEQDLIFKLMDARRKK